MTDSLPEPGGLWAGLRVDDEVGRGGFGRVYRAWDDHIGRWVALKVLYSADLDDSMRQRFLRESRIAGRLEHPRIVPIYSAGEHDGVPYIVMRYLGGGDLRVELAEGPLSAARTASVTTQVAEALDRAHRDGLIHRDVKPANVLRDSTGDGVYLADFGITRAIAESTSQRLTQQGAAPATVLYAAPEQLSGREAGPAADVYSLACLAFECLTGHPPYQGDSALAISFQHATADIPTVTEARRELPDAVDSVIRRALAKHAGHRHETAGALAEALGGALSGVREDAAGPDVPSGRDQPATQPHRPVFLGATARSGDAAGGERPGPSAPRAGSTSVFGTGGASPRTSPQQGRTPHSVPSVRPATPRSRTASPPHPAPPRRARRRLWPAVVGVLVLLAAGAGGTWLALAADDGDDEEEALSNPDVERLRELVPRSVRSTCAVAEADDVAPEALATLRCAPDVPDLVMYRLFDGDEGRNAAFDRIVEQLRISGEPQQDCETGGTVVHFFTTEAEPAGDAPTGTGRVACKVTEDQVGLSWTFPGAPVMASAALAGQPAALGQWWADQVDREDEPFPTSGEQRLLEVVPEEWRQTCGRDRGLAAVSGGIIAVECHPGGEGARTVSYVVFRNRAAMDSWLDERTAEVVALNPAVGDVVAEAGACTGGAVADHTSTAGVEEVSGDGSAGRLLCFVNRSGANVLFWTRLGPNIGSIATAPAAETSMAELVEWWSGSGRQP